MPPGVVGALERAKDLGFLGDAPLGAQVEHAMGFATAALGGAGAPPPTMLDLGSGGGIPGLVLAALWPATEAVLLDANERRCAALEQAVEGCGWSGRVRVIRDRAELAGRDPVLRGSIDLVVARSFGSPAVTAECAAPFLRVGAILVVSEPPLDDGATSASTGEATSPVGHPDRWPADRLELVGLVPVRFHSLTSGYQVLRQQAACPDRYPRRLGVPAKRPLY